MIWESGVYLERHNIFFFIHSCFSVVKFAVFNRLSLAEVVLGSVSALVLWCLGGLSRCRGYGSEELEILEQRHSDFN